MTANTKLIHAIADALIGEYDEEATEWLEDGGAREHRTHCRRVARRDRGRALGRAARGRAGTPGASP